MKPDAGAKQETGIAVKRSETRIRSFRGVAVRGGEIETAQESGANVELAGELPSVPADGFARQVTFE